MGLQRQRVMGIVYTLWKCTVEATTSVQQACEYATRSKTVLAKLVLTIQTSKLESAIVEVSNTFINGSYEPVSLAWIVRSDQWIR